MTRFGVSQMTINKGDTQISILPTHRVPGKPFSRVFVHLAAATLATTIAALLLLLAFVDTYPQIIDSITRRPPPQLTGCVFVMRVHPPPPTQRAQGSEGQVMAVLYSTLLHVLSLRVWGEIKVPGCRAMGT